MSKSSLFSAMFDNNAYLRDKKFSFRRLKDGSVMTYSLILHRFVFNCLRFYVREGWTSSYKYPNMDISQIQRLQLLDDALDQEQSEKEIDQLFHQACYSLFAHEKHMYPASNESGTNFFSPVICFLVLHCVSENGSTPFSSSISNVVAPIMYSIRACVFREILDLRKKQP